MLKKDVMPSSFAGDQLLVSVVALVGALMLVYSRSLADYVLEIKRKRNYPEHMLMAPEFQAWGYRIIGICLIGSASFVAYKAVR